jgi:hypothetical protein
MPFFRDLRASSENTNCFAVICSSLIVVNE